MNPLTIKGALGDKKLLLDIHVVRPSTDPAERFAHVSELSSESLNFMVNNATTRYIS
jgi:hypothetical protein